MERVLVDMDEVMADPMGRMIAWYESNYGRKVVYDKMENGSWVKGFPEEHQVMVRQRLHEPGFFRDLPVMKDCQEVIEAINKKYELFIVSAATEFPNSLKDKLEWLGDYFPFLSWRQVVLCGDKRLVTGDYMIDDHPRNLVHFKGKQYLYSAPHNMGVTEFHRVNNWREVAEIFL